MIKAITGLVLVALAGGVGLGLFFKRSKLLEKPTELDKRKEELEGKLEDIEEAEKKLKEDGVEDIESDKVIDYWDKENK